MLRVLIISFVAFIGITQAFAQTSQPISSQNNRFGFPESIVCASYGGNGEIIINTTALECDGDPPCVIDFNYNAAEGFGRKPDPANPSVFISDPDNIRLFQDGQPVDYTFTQPGTFNIAILIGAGTNNFDELVQPLVVLSSAAPEFDISNCSSGEVQVEITDTNFPQYVVDYDEDNVSDAQSAGGTVNPRHTYPPAQIQGVISVAAAYDGCTENTKVTQLVTGAFTNNHFISRLEVAGADQIPLTFQNTGANIPYVLERSANGVGSFSAVNQFANATQITDTGVDADQNFYCYRLGARDVCNNQTFYTNVVCSHAVDLDIRDGDNLVQWNSNLSGAAVLTLVKNGNAIDPGFTNSGSYTDTDVVCGTNYCYQFVTDYGSGIQSVSRSLCGVAVSSQPPLPINDITSVVDGNSVNLRWATNPDYTIGEFDILRIPTNVALPYASTSELTFTDDTYQPFNGICYQIRFDDVCKNRSERSPAVCPVELLATLDENDNSVHLQWNAYQGWAAGVDHYIVEKYNSDGVLISSTNSLQATSYTDSDYAPGQIFSYRILAFPVSSALPDPSVSNVQTIIKSPRLYHPTAFIPQNASNERNRTFSVKGTEEYIASYELRIFNRWGELMFFSTDMNNEWDGTFKGVTMPEGTYIFKTRVVDTAGRNFDYSGSVVLLRK
jgi:gliding motility-associated-like protein